MNKRRKININAFYILIFILFIILISCKSTQEKDKTERTTPKNDPTRYVIDKDNIKEDELRNTMNALFDLIEKYIAKNDFNGWYNFLSDNYKSYLNDSHELQRLSEVSDYLYNRNIVLRSPRDYFENLVVPSREEKSLEFLDYEYLDENNVNVISLFDKKEKYIYKFVFEDGTWKLSR